MKKSPKVNRLFTLTSGGNLVYLAEVSDAVNSMALFKRVAYEMAKKAQKNYSNLILSPETIPRPDKFKWKTKQGEFSKLP